MRRSFTPTYKHRDLGHDCHAGRPPRLAWPQRHTCSHAQSVLCVLSSGLSCRPCHSARLAERSWLPLAPLSLVQAGPPDPHNFPFMVLGNKIDENGGSSRQVSGAAEAHTRVHPPSAVVVLLWLGWWSIAGHHGVPAETATGIGSRRDGWHSRLARLIMATGCVPTGVARQPLVHCAITPPARARHAAASSCSE